MPQGSVDNSKCKTAADPSRAGFVAFYNDCMPIKSNKPINGNFDFPFSLLYYKHESRGSTHIVLQLEFTLSTPWG